MAKQTTNHSLRKRINQSLDRFEKIYANIWKAKEMNCKMNFGHSDRLCKISVSLQGIERDLNKADCKSREEWYEGRWWEYLP